MDVTRRNMSAFANLTSSYMREAELRIVNTIDVGPSFGATGAEKHVHRERRLVISVTSLVLWFWLVWLRKEHFSCSAQL